MKNPINGDGRSDGRTHARTNEVAKPASHEWMNGSVYSMFFLTVVIPYLVAFTAHAKNQAVQVSWCDQDSEYRGETQNADGRSQ